ncbi:hypothetical protein [Nocardia sp. GAS34]|uniref:hypothetical protein n=1 Tax=unclassified Nocardia TaxID=2637762 RepID=UPI003D2154FA
MTAVLDDSQAFPPEQAVDVGHRFPLHLLHDFQIEGRRRVDRGMAQNPLNRRHINTLSEQQRRAGVTEVMQPDRPAAGPG